MKNLFSVLAILFACLVTGTALVRPPEQTNTTMTQMARVPVVVELFTSEGCSSCPPADALLAKLSDGNVAGNVQLIALEEHVDYWDDQGWVDPFSSHDWTSRQYVYADALGNKNAYTPQMVVDGSVEFVGSHSQKAREAIVKAAGNMKIPASLAQRKANAGVLGFSAKTGKVEKGTKGDVAEVWLAITETRLHSAVTRGENRGEDLHHAAIVRSMRKLGEAKPDRDISFEGETDVPLKKEWKQENLKAVLFVQEKKSRRILGAAEIGVAP